MTLRPHVLKMLEQTDSTQEPETVQDLIKSRGKLLQHLPPLELRPIVDKTEDFSIPGPGGEIPVRIYTPRSAGQLPLFVYFHGGGFVAGSIEEFDHFCRWLATTTRAKVISVGYRLAPEHPFPAGLEDCFAAVKWVEQHRAELNGKPGQLIVGGESAGGNLAAAVALLARDQEAPAIAKQVLIYPVTDCFSLTAPCPYSSYVQFASGYRLTARSMDLFWSAYLTKKEDAQSPFASPIRAQDLSGLPPTLVLTAEYDILRDEGESYAQRLSEAGVPVLMKRIGGTIHGFALVFTEQQDGREALDAIAAFVGD
ncbi:alpha/beta hydrolase [Brevibacillus fulvus]|uniref:Acetyl esterase n=1 Tax=Brevibacillus fulvus TaxID=1125967 RepID=A0A939BV84_9BACL|nr:alpha/beta hydrolase [Brevibacillus fulvus]MBM7590401.1 acetyl esterase [Brevibacillus fulvus]